MNLLDAIRLCGALSRTARPEPGPLALPDWLNSSEVSYAVRQVGAVRYRGETIRSAEDIRGQEGPR